MFIQTRFLFKPLSRFEYIREEISMIDDSFGGTFPYALLVLLNSLVHRASASDLGKALLLSSSPQSTGNLTVCSNARTRVFDENIVKGDRSVHGLSSRLCRRKPVL